jgi:serine/threonine-protein phosphatase 2A regulatory subunit A
LQHQPTDIVGIYKHLSQDEQDSVRQLAVMGAVAIGKVINDATENNNNVFPVVRNACNDKSWRVRHAVAKNYNDLAGALQISGDAAVEIIACFIGLLTDTEAEVRGAACVNIASMVEFAGEGCFTSDIAPLLDGLSNDPVMEVRSKLSSALMDCTNADVCSQLTDAIVLDKIQPVLEAMLKNEEESDEVKINILRKLPGLSGVLSQMSEIVTVVVSLAKYQLNWRVRESVAKILPALAEAFGIEKFTSGNPSYLSLYLDLLQDEVADVRTACISGAYKIYEVACSDKDGAAWVQKNIIGATKPIYDASQFYRTRITTLTLYTAFCPNDATPKALLEDVVSNLLKALDDPVANVRMVAARGLLALVGFCDDNIINTAIKPQIQTVCDARDLSKQDEMDSDNDLRIYLRKLNTVLEV